MKSDIRLDLQVAICHKGWRRVYGVFREGQQVGAALSWDGVLALLGLWFSPLGVLQFDQQTRARYASWPARGYDAMV